MRADGRPGSPGLAEAGGLIVTVAALPFAIPRWGITGAAWVSVASYAVTAVTLAVLWMLRGASLLNEHYCRSRNVSGISYALERSRCRFEPPVG